MHVLYIDILILVNILIDYFALKVTLVILGKLESRIRIGIAAVTGGILSLLILLPIKNSIIQAFIKLLVSAMLASIVCGLRPTGQFARTVFVLYSVSMLICGASWLLSPENYGIYQNNFFIYLDISPLSLIMAVSLCYFAAAALDFIFPSTRPGKYTEIEIDIEGRSDRFRALVDTGNLLRSTIDGKRVVIIDSSYAGKLADKMLIQRLAEGTADETLIEEGHHIRFIPYSTVSGSGTLIGLCCKTRTISPKGKISPAYDMVAVFQDLGLDHGETTAIIGDI